MAKYEEAFQALMKEEGIGLSDNPADKGGQTFAGISRKNWPKWDGWRFVDTGVAPPTQLVRDFYFDKFWMPIKGDQVNDQQVANALFSQYVNMGETAIRLAQGVLGTVADGKIGPKTLAALNAFSPERFRDRFALAMVARYLGIGLRDKSQRVFWAGWFSRALRIAA